MYGTLSTIDTLLSNNQSVADFGEEALTQSLMIYVEAHNGIVRDFMSMLVDRTSDKERIYGSADQLNMVRVDEFAHTDSQKTSYGVRCGFPLHSFEIPVQWTRKYFITATVGEVARQFLAVQAADSRAVVTEAKRAIFGPTNYDFDDYIANRRTVQQLNVRRLLNADGNPIPPSPSGDTFDGSTHTHYLATASFTNANLASTLETVLEHYSSGDGMIYINRSQESTVRGFTEFREYVEPGYVQRNDVVSIPGKTLNPVATYNRAIGQFRGAEVWVKPWMINNYVFAFMVGPPKPIAMRTRNENSGNLELVSENESYPLRARIWEREFGMGVQERSNGAILYTGGASYVSPTIT